MKQKNSTSDMACLASNFPRLVGLAQASKVYRENKDLKNTEKFSNNGSEIAFGTIGNSSCAEGHFFEAVNAIGVLQVPAIISVWDDGYGISVGNEYQMTKSDVSEVLKGFQRDEKGEGTRTNIRSVMAGTLVSLRQNQRAFPPCTTSLENVGAGGFIITKIGVLEPPPVPTSREAGRLPGPWRRRLRVGSQPVGTDHERGAKRS